MGPWANCELVLRMAAKLLKTTREKRGSSNITGGNLLRPERELSIVREYNICRFYNGTVASGIGGSPEFYQYEDRLDMHSIGKILPKIIKKGKVVDVGCGFGRLTIWFAKKGFEAIGVDVSVDAVKIALNNSKTHKLYGLHFIVGSAHMLPLRSDVADLTCCVRAMSILVRAGLLEESLAELTRITMPRGKLLLIDLFPRKTTMITPYVTALSFLDFKSLLGDRCSIKYCSGLSVSEKLRSVALSLKRKAFEKEKVRPLGEALFRVSLHILLICDRSLSGPMSAKSDRKLVLLQKGS
jgi:ubiquinone/menaquinone biosynthesis C-methylase UbiE